MSSPVEKASLDAVVRGLVREYLYRNGHRDVLDVFDRHVARGPPLTTIELVKSLRLVKLYKRNVDRADPFLSVLEVLTHYFLHDAVSSEKAAVDRAEAASELPGGVPKEPPLVASAGSKATPGAGSSFFARIAASKAAAAAASAPLIPMAALAPPDASSDSEPKASPPLGGHNDKATAATSLPASDGDSTATTAALPTVAVLTSANVEKIDSTAPDRSLLVIDLPSASAAPLAQPLPSGDTADASSASAPSATPLTFFQRIAANKAAAAAAASKAAAEAPPPTSAPSTAPPVSGTGTAPSAPAPALSFFERLAASKAAAAATASGAASAAPPAPASSAVTPTAPGASAFVAPDGRSFSDRTEYRRYLSETFYTFASRSGETLTKAPGDIKGQMFLLRDLTDCTVRLCDHSETVQMDRLTRCTVLVGSSCESVFMRNCVDCTFSIACKQLRTRDCARCVTHLYAKTDPIIEKSYAMEFLPFNAAYPGLREHFAAARLEPQYNHWRRIFDFSADDLTMPRPHWTIGDVATVKQWTIDDLPATSTRGLPPENPVPVDAAPKSDGGKDIGPSRGAAAATDLLAFDIRSTSQAAAQAALDKAEAQAVAAE